MFRRTRKHIRVQGGGGVEKERSKAKAASGGMTQGAMVGGARTWGSRAGAGGRTLPDGSRRNSGEWDQSGSHSGGTRVPLEEASQDM